MPPAASEQKLLQAAGGDRERPGGKHVHDCSGFPKTRCRDIFTSVPLSVCHHHRCDHPDLSSITHRYVPSTFDLGQVRSAEDSLFRTRKLKAAHFRNARVPSLTGTHPLVMSLGTLLQRGK